MQGETEAEWKELHAAAIKAGRRTSDLAEHLSHACCALLLEFVPGRPLFETPQAFQEPTSFQTAGQLGRYIF